MEIGEIPAKHLEEPHRLDLTATSIWDRRVEVEQSGYYWLGSPIVMQASQPPDGNRPALVEMFCGCGGLSLGFQMAGFEPVLGTDIHEPSALSYHHNHPSAKVILADVRRLDPADVLALLDDRRIDVFAAGVPCQGFSISNRKRSDMDKRNFLFHEFVRFVRYAKPRAVVLENVSTLESAANGSFYSAIKSAIAECAAYDVYARVLNAADYGVPQFRRRLFVVGVPRGAPFAWPEPTHGYSPGLSRYVTVWEAIGDLPPLGAGETATEYRCGPQTEYQALMRGSVTLLTNHVAPNHTQATIEMIERTPPGQPMYERFRQRVRLAPDLPSPTQVAGGIRPQFQFGHPTQERGLTIRERCRLQSFPDSFTVMGGLVQGRVQTGNAVPPLLARALAEALRDAISA